MYPRNDRKNGVISRLLPQVKSDTKSIDDFDLLRISSVVDGTEIKGHGQVNGHSYGWKMAIESAVKSIAVVPDRFFDVTGRSYSIDQSRKISVDSLPDYENYKDAIIYRINTSNKYMAPPIATIIYDNEMQNRRGIEKTVSVGIPATALADFENNQNVKITTLLYKAEALWEGNCFMTTTNSEEVEGVTVETTVLDTGTTAPNTLVSGGVCYGAGKTHVLLNPNETTKIVDKTQELKITVRVFTLNNYGIEQFLGTTPVSKIIADVEGSLVGYLQNHATTLLFDWNRRTADFPDAGEDFIGKEYKSVEAVTDELDIKEGEYLAIIVDNNNNYYPLIGKTVTPLVNGSEEIDDIPASDDPQSAASGNDKFAQTTVEWFKPQTDVELSQFKNVDMWLRFNSINEMIYFLITKYEEDIMEIKPVTINPKSETPNGNWDVNRNTTTTTPSTELEDAKAEGRLWAYVNPRTMKPYEDDYWFHSGEPYYVKSLTIAPDNKKLKAQQIIVRADEWPGMYMVVGETVIRNRDTGKDERMQIKFPQAKVKADQTLTLQADGDPTTFTLNLEIAKPRNGHMMELTAYEIAPKMTQGENGCFYAADGSSEVVIE